MSPAVRVPEVKPGHHAGQQVPAPSLTLLGLLRVLCIPTLSFPQKMSLPACPFKTRVSLSWIPTTFYLNGFLKTSFLCACSVGTNSEPLAQIPTTETRKTLDHFLGVRKPSQVQNDPGFLSWPRFSACVTGNSPQRCWPSDTEPSCPSSDLQSANPGRGALKCFQKPLGVSDVS